jgi:hypothetical protein
MLYQMSSSHNNSCLSCKRKRLRTLSGRERSVVRLESAMPKSDDETVYYMGLTLAAVALLLILYFGSRYFHR